jgi:RHS repeat-associated protein
MRWVLMLFVVFAAVMGGEARAVVVMGRSVMSERVVGAEMVEERAEALRIESERASRGMVREVEEAAGLVDAGPLVLWFPGGLAVARSDCLSGTGTTGCRRVSSTVWRYDLADNRVARTETEERRVVNSTSWVRTAAADQRCLYRNAAGTGPNGRNQLSQSWETRTRWDAESGAPLELSEQTVSYRYDPRGNRTRRTMRLWKQARTTGSAAWPVPTVTDTDEALEWDGENRLTGMWRGRWKEELAQVPFESLVGKAVEGSTVWRWGYDHRSRRVQRDEPGSGGERLRTVTVFAGGTSAAEYTETAAAGSAWTVPPAATVQHVRGPDLGGGTKGLLYSLRRSLQPNEQSTWLPTFNRYNGRGDVVAQSDIDGTTTWAASYQADGRRTAEAGTNIERHRACTKEEDPTGLLNEGFRYRDMETGTFISRDPLGHVDGPNVYCYVRQNPWTKIDPEGLRDLDISGDLSDLPFEMRGPVCDMQAKMFAGTIAGIVAAVAAAPAAAATATYAGLTGAAANVAVVAGTGAAGGWVGNGVANKLEGEDFSKNGVAAAASGIALSVLGHGVAQGISKAFPRVPAGTTARPLTTSGGMPQPLELPGAGTVGVANNAVPQVLRNQTQGALGEAAVRARLLNSNRLDLVGEQIRLTTPGVGSYRVTDFMVQSRQTGRRSIIEVKTGGATRDATQLAKDALIADPLAPTTFTGSRAADAGFPSGTPTGPIRTFEVNASNINR